MKERQSGTWVSWGQRGIWILLLALGGGIAETMAQGLNPVRFRAELEPAQIRVGEKARIVLTATIDPGWHLYSLSQPEGGPRPTRISLEEGGPLRLLSAPVQPKPRVAPDPNFSLPGEPPFLTETFEGQVDFLLSVVAEGAPSNTPRSAGLKVYFQACDDHQCLPPRTRPVDLAVTILPGGATSDPLLTVLQSSSATAPSPVQTEGTPSPTVDGELSTGPTTAPLPAEAEEDESDVAAERALRTRGLLSYILFAMGVGLLSLLTPCVFPMIPITVSFFTKKEHQSTGESIRQALLYCFGIIFTFTFLGLALTLVAGPSGINRLAASPWMNLFLTLLFVIFALNLFGMFELQLPSGFINRLDAKTQTGTTAATLLMGLTFTLTSFTCTAAFVGTVLVAVTQGDWFWPAIGMLSFSTAFALPFFLLAIFPRYLQSLPKSGGWMNSVKVVMGFLELGAAFKFLSNVDLVWGWNTVSRPLVLAAWIALSLVTALYLLGKFLLPHDSPVARLSVVRMLFATLFLGLALYFTTGLFGANLGEWEAMLPPAPKGEISRQTGSLSTTEPGWIESYEAGLARGVADNRPVFLNFTGVTCTNCRWMESNLFPDPRVQKELARFVRVELFTDRETPEDEQNSALQAEKFATVALPLYAIVSPTGTILARFPGLTRNPEEFVAFLQRGARRFEERQTPR
jgi:thiol:disulfide interchange protein